jgi:hypothetical protein
MKGSQFMHLPCVAALVRKYQARWQSCLVEKTHSYHWPGSSAKRN